MRSTDGCTFTELCLVPPLSLAVSSALNRRFIKYKM